jgi:RNA-directed DNA polymerase
MNAINYTNILGLHESRGHGGSCAPDCEAQLTLSTSHNSDCLTNLMNKIASKANLVLAFKAVKRNKGAPGVDKMTVMEVSENLDIILEELSLALINQTYRPCAVRGVKIPKINGGLRQLGIPIVIDRIVQQAIAQVLTKIYDHTFSNSSFGFRPKRSANMAIKASSGYVEEGKVWVVDIDLEQFFDKVNHDILMSKIAKTIKDKSLLRLIRRFLTAGLMQDGVYSAKGQEGTPQGGPLSPLLSNILLDTLDQELERRGHSFCRYADDCNIYVNSEMAGKRVMTSITKFLKERLKLIVNTDKSAVNKVKHRQFLGFRILNNADITISKASLKKIKDKIRKLTRRNRAVSLDVLIKELNQIIRGWYHYFKDTKSASLMKGLDAWIRRKIRCFRIKQRKRKYSIKTMLTAMKINQQDAWSIACSSVGWWRKSLNHIVHRAMNLEWFSKLGLFSLSLAFGKHNSKTAVCEIACTVV